MKVLVLALLAIVPAAFSQCSIKVQTHTPKSLAPVYLTDKNELWPMDATGSLTWTKGQKTKVLCSGPDNVLTLNNKALTTMECVSGTSFKADNGKTEDIKKWVCKAEVVGDLKDTQKKCGDNNAGTLYEIGFASGTAKEFVKFYDVCYKKATGSALYTQHKIYGTAIFSKCDTQNRKRFELTGTPPECKTLDAEYVQKDQVTRFTAQSAALGKRLSANRLEKGHLTPYCDALFQSWKHATQFYVNTAPEFQRTNGGNWKRVETQVRDQAVALKAHLDVYTGTYGVLELENVAMKFLKNGWVEVPKYFWKIVKNPKDNKGIAFVTYNNLWATEHKKICTDICAANKWDKNGYEDLAKGITYCCDPNELMKTVKGIPKGAATKGVMQFAAAVRPPGSK